MRDATDDKELEERDWRLGLDERQYRLRRCTRCVAQHRRLNRNIPRFVSLRPSLHLGRDEGQAGIFRAPVDPTFPGSGDPSVAALFAKLGYDG